MWRNKLCMRQTMRSLRITLNPTLGGHVTYMVEGAPHHQTNTQARGQSGQSSLQEDSNHRSQPQPQPGMKHITSSSKSKTRFQKCNYVEYNLGYFNLWWSRMEREWFKDEFTRQRKEEDNRTSERLKTLLTAGKPNSRAEEDDVTNVKIETDNAIYERPDTIQSQPYVLDRNCLMSLVGREVNISDGGKQLSKKMRLSSKVCVGRKCREIQLF